MTVPLTLPRLRTLLNLPWLMLVSGIVFIISQTALALTLVPLGEPEILFRVQLLFTTAADYQAQFNAWEAAGVLGAYEAHLILDALHPVWYATFATCVLAVLFSRRGASAAWDRLLPLPMLSGLLDVLENGMQAMFLNHPAALTDGLVFMSWLCSAGKWGLVLIYVVAALYWIPPRRR
ncbi:hypothetical protein S7S_13065 [Isoalcanivorax pacificus W11-5]|uniref:Uncharacterized protein n=1 Tax=Isoalcanivorax pacificus W11-5 TaxID=391936 RepID=A0A0B4XQH0_9GAMM|nr:hypothetical protein [Isoalcanivorax pacificus]AJD49025.1 hypothetical protein S7S_13065 [Isoalcanivorax pacificus W11-5]